ncbi:MAG: YqaA family protein, partial [Planctomycetota bacterium]
MEGKPPAEDAAPATRNPLKRLYRWILSWADHPHGAWALFFLALTESSFFPIPPDVLLIALVLGRRDKAWWYALVCTVGSLIGAVIGYIIGWGLWEATKDFWFSYVFSQEAFDFVKQAYQDHTALAAFGSAFTFIPYKVFTITAGVCGVNLALFLAASLVGRAGRFFIVGAVF